MELFPITFRFSLHFQFILHVWEFKLNVGAGLETIGFKDELIDRSLVGVIFFRDALNVCMCFLLTLAPCVGDLCMSTRINNDFYTASLINSLNVRPINISIWPCVGKFARNTHVLTLYCKISACT